MPLGTLRQQLLFPTNCSKSSPSVMAYLAAQQQQQQAQQRKQQQQQSESTPLLGGLKHRSHAYAAAASSSAAAHTNDAVTGMESSGAAAAAADVCVSAGAAAAAGEDGDGGSCAGVDEQLQALLSAVNLGHLLHRFPGGLDAQVDWASVLSLGEQQRVALVRLLFHRPLLAFLDEATAALDPRSEAVAYGLIARACSCYVSVGHRPQLLDWHSHVLVAAGPPGLWAKYTAAEFRARRTAGLEA
jgi:ABC-type sugar transport system ATPase subunit